MIDRYDPARRDPREWLPGIVREIYTRGVLEEVYRDYRIPPDCQVVEDGLQHVAQVLIGRLLFPEEVAWASLLLRLRYLEQNMGLCGATLDFYPFLLFF